ncbi:MAG: hypothetical protein A3F74_18605 [Betaproteobacteria bacterium RIFCSPLOWO2_12_FULL_62_58]|nr:MAG: hypothetical protein A3F74_18605 [Betaproteobacteria bacterium RIFCSPLOWO2_12_FULL_62_58]
MKVNDLPAASALAAHDGRPDSSASATTPWEQAWRYQTDLLQRTVLFLDILREQELSKQISAGLDSYRKRRDEWAEAVFKWLYG